MFSQQSIKTAKGRINGEFKAFLTSDSSLYIVKRDEDISGILKHCSDNKLVLFDVEENKEIQLKIKSKKDGSAES